MQPHQAAQLEVSRRSVHDVSIWKSDVCSLLIGAARASQNSEHVLGQSAPDCKGDKREAVGSAIHARLPPGRAMEVERGAPDGNELTLFQLAQARAGGL